MADNAAEMAAASARATQDILLMMSQFRRRLSREPPKVKCPICNEPHSYQPAPDRGRLEDRFSHDARIVYQSGPCPICLEDRIEPPMVVFVCGHVVCRDDFKRLGGKIGQEAMQTAEQVLQEMRNNESSMPLEGAFMDMEIPPLGMRSLVRPWIMQERHQDSTRRSNNSDAMDEDDDDDDSSGHSSMPELLPRAYLRDFTGDDEDDDEYMPELISRPARRHDSDDDDNDSLPPLLPRHAVDTDDDDIVSVSHAGGNNPMDDSDIQTMPETVTSHVPREDTTESSPEFHTPPDGRTQSNQDDDDSMPDLMNPRVSDIDSSAGDNADASSSSANVPSHVNVEDVRQRLDSTFAELETDMRTISALFRRYDEQMVHLMGSIPPGALE